MGLLAHDSTHQEVTHYLKKKHHAILTAVRTEEDSGFDTLWLLKNIDSLSAV